MKNTDEIRGLLKAALPPLADAEPRRDLWPLMLRRLEEQPRRVPWFDWALAGVVALWALASPQMIPVLLFHL